MDRSDVLCRTGDYSRFPNTSCQSTFSRSMICWSRPRVIDCGGSDMVVPIYLVGVMGKPVVPSSAGS